MQMLGAAFSTRGRDNLNNFLILRLLAASLVVYGHSFPLAAACASCHDVIMSFFHYRYAGDLGLHIFFVISGFLVTASFDARRDLFEFLKARALRIFPGLFVCIGLLVCLGAALTTLSPTSYWSSDQTRSFFWTNASLFSYVEKLPGVFETNKFGSSVNGALWTLWIEARLYLVVLLLGVFGVIAKQWIANVAILALVLIGIFDPTHIILIGENVNHLRLGVFFALGAALYVNRDLIPLTRDGLFILLVCALLSAGTSNFELFAGLAIAYGVFLFAFSKKVPIPKVIADYSYGIYLYGWPIQQLVAHFAPTWNSYQMMAVALPGAWICGALSWHFVESRALKLKGARPLRASRNLLNAAISRSRKAFS